MNLRLLGVHNRESDETRLSCGLVDGVLALDAGAITRSLSFDEQRAITSVLVTHRHFDHIRDLATLGQNTRGVSSKQLVAPTAVHADLRRHLLNGVIWSRFYESPDRDRPSFIALPLDPGQSVNIGEYRVRAVTTAHSAPSAGFLVRLNASALFFTGDTGTGFAASLVAAEPDGNVSLIVVEVSYENAADQMAEDQGHLTPQRLERELAELESGWTTLPRILIVHRDPAHESSIRSEIDAIAARRKWPIVLPDAGSEWEV